MNVKMMLMRMIINDKDIYEEDNDFYLIDSILEGADSSGHVVRDDPVKGAGEEGDHDEEDQDQDDSDDENVGDNYLAKMTMALANDKSSNTSRVVLTS